MTEKERIWKINKGLYCGRCETPTILRVTEDSESGITRILECPKCKDNVRCHPGTDRGMGRIADRRTRKLRYKAHQWFDAIWKNKLKRSRYNAYSWLTLRLDMNRDNVHFSLFSAEECEQSISICKEYIKRKAPELYTILDEQLGA